MQRYYPPLQLAAHSFVSDFYPLSHADLRPMSPSSFISWKDEGGFNASWQPVSKSPSMERTMRSFISLIEAAVVAAGSPVASDDGTGIERAQAVCSFLENTGLNGNCAVDAKETLIEVSLAGRYDSPADCSKVVDMLRAHGFQLGPNWELRIKASIKDEPEVTECGLAPGQ